MSRMTKMTREGGLQHTLSDSDVSNASVTSAPSFVSQRNKRQRQSSEEQLLSFKDDIMNMIDEWKKSQNSLLNKLISEVAEIKTQNTEIKHTNDEIEKSMKFLNTKYEDMLKKIDALEVERKQHLLKINLLETSLDDIQRNLKSSSIELRNVPISSEIETKTDLCKIVQRTCNVLDVNVQEMGIRDVFRVNSKSGKGTIVAELASVLLKQDIIQGIKSFKKQNSERSLTSSDIGIVGQKTPIFISEALTSKNRRLFFLARDLATSMSYKFCWTANGKIYLRKAVDAPRIEVKDESQIAALRNLK